MQNDLTFEFRFVEFVPETLQDGIIYVSTEYATASHKCACGCGKEVVTPLSPTDWSLTFDGVSISLDPSIGNWNFPCRSHYWIRQNKVTWAKKWSDEKIEAGRAHDRKMKDNFYRNKEQKIPTYANAHEGKDGKGWLRRLWIKK